MNPGASIPCYCKFAACLSPNRGWKICILLQVISISVNIALFISGCVGLDSDSLDTDKYRALVILVACDFLSVCAMSFVIHMARCALTNHVIELEVELDKQVQLNANASRDSKAPIQVSKVILQCILYITVRLLEYGIADVDDETILPYLSCLYVYRLLFYLK